MSSSLHEEKSLKESYDGIVEARESLDSLGVRRRLNLKMNKGHAEFLAQVEEFLRDGMRVSTSSCDASNSSHRKWRILAITVTMSCRLSWDSLTANSMSYFRYHFTSELRFDYR